MARDWDLLLKSDLLISPLDQTIIWIECFSLFLAVNPSCKISISYILFSTCHYNLTLQSHLIKESQVTQQSQISMKCEMRLYSEIRFIRQPDSLQACLINGNYSKPLTICETVQILFNLNETVTTRYGYWPFTWSTWKTSHRAAQNHFENFSHLLVLGLKVVKERFGTILFDLTIWYSTKFEYLYIYVELLWKLKFIS